MGGCLRGERLPDDFDYVVSLHPQTRYELAARTERVEMAAVDNLTQDLAVFQRAAVLVARRVAVGDKVLVHCQAGLNRSGLAAALALVELGHTPPAALQMLRDRRSKFVLSNPAFRVRLLLGRAPRLLGGSATRWGLEPAETMTADDCQRFATVMQETEAPLPASTERVSQVRLWRLYWLHRGRLSSPCVGALEPLPRRVEATCSYDRMPGRGNLAAHPASEIPALNCQCGWRGADTAAALEPAGRKMENAPHGFLPIHRHIQDEGYDSVDEFAEQRSALLAGGARAAAGRMLPVPAVVRVTAHDAVRDDRIAHRQEFLATEAGQRVTAYFDPLGVAPAELFRGVPEMRGMWRARSLTITGPVITGPTAYADPDLRDLEAHYGVRAISAGHQDSLRRTRTPG